MSVEAKKVKGEYAFKLIAVDAPNLGPSRRIYLAGDAAECAFSLGGARPPALPCHGLPCRALGTGTGRGAHGSGAGMRGRRGASWPALPVRVNRRPGSIPPPRVADACCDATPADNKGSIITELRDPLLNALHHERVFEARATGRAKRIF